ncbi:SDR family oxidoreductase [Janibacter sp. FSL W8-0316]|uniref:SDR family oxidoreductase n=1 Tax=Janibacter sp. FSL W8-0316 TaxID=2975325 RepID=UPI0030F76100
MNQRTALVTGASKGIGLEIARQLAEAGVHVLVTGRNQTRVWEATKSLSDEGLSVTPVVLDVTDDATFVDACRHLDEHNDGRLDILINNAAIRIEPYGRSPSQQSLANWQTTFTTNLFGAVRVTQEFLPYLLRSSAGRIVNVSSLLASLDRHSDRTSYTYSDTFKSLPAYSASKTALNSWTVHLAYELRDTPIKVNAAHPGYTRTDLNDGEGDLEPAEAAQTAVRLALLDKAGPTGSFVTGKTSLPW